MKAIRVHEFGKPEVMRLEEVPNLKPEPGQVVVRVHAVGVNPVDTYLRSGFNPKLELPYTPGIDAAGVVEYVGEGVSHIAVGDRVYTAGAISGTYAELALCDRSQVHRLPQSVSYAQGAALNVPYATAYRALFQRAKAVPGEVVLVHGASGGVGVAAVQLARAAGMIVIGTASSEPGRRLVAEQGAHHVLDHHAPDYLQQVFALSDGFGVSVILEMRADANLDKDLDILAQGGRVVIVGSLGNVEINPRNAMARDANILGMSLLNAQEQEISIIHAALVAGLENRTLRPIVGQEMPLKDAPHAHETVMKSGAYGKIVLIP